MLHNFDFKYHPGGDPYSPQYFFKIKKGDCKDYAKFAEYCLRRAGYNAKYTKVGRGRGSHIICVYKEKGKYFVVDNDNLRGPYDSYNQMIRRIKSLHKA